ncbi:hypothetical protein H5410_050366 [Solanum commersonii]|uniref:Uncharacterized protein n=1 Tax=Solanum commersonii TaxID=4109 RepID=A0A9J5WV95_SOLCO|nr:hypothetical protein H5410_050366 [Solanum commersonii]
MLEQSLQNPLKLENENILIFENLCSSESLSAVSQDRRYTRRSAFWLISSPSCFSLQPLRILSWLNAQEKKAISRLIGDSPIGLGNLQTFISLFFSAALFFMPTDHSAQLFRIVNTLGNPSFGRFHRLLALAFSLFTL